MAYFAKIQNGIVTDVVVADIQWISEQPGFWLETFLDGRIRKRYAGIGFTYRQDIDAFIPPHPHVAGFNLDKQFIFDEEICGWVEINYPGDPEQ